MNGLPGIYLTWTESAELMTVFLRYQVYRRTLGQGDADWVALARGRITDRGLTFYQDYTVAAGVTYEYAVTQITEVGGEEVESAFPTAVQATATFSQLYVHDVAAPQNYANLMAQAQQVEPVQEIAYLQPFSRTVPSARVGNVLQTVYRASLKGQWDHSAGELAREQWDALMTLLARQRDAGAVLCIRQGSGLRFFGVMEAPRRSDESASQFQEEVRFREVHYTEAG